MEAEMRRQRRSYPHLLNGEKNLTVKSCRIRTMAPASLLAALGPRCSDSSSVLAMMSFVHCGHLNRSFKQVPCVFKLLSLGVNYACYITLSTMSSYQVSFYIDNPAVCLKTVLL